MVHKPSLLDIFLESLDQVSCLNIFLKNGCSQLYWFLMGIVRVDFLIDIYASDLARFLNPLEKTVHYPLWWFHL